MIENVSCKLETFLQFLSLRVSQMADMCNAAAGRSSSPPEPDDFSLFLHQILLRSSSSSSIAGPTSTQSALPSPGSGNRVPTGGYFPANVSSSSVGTIENDVDEYDCQSEERGFEAVVEEVPAKAAPSRNSAKRSRAAEVHNMSEKRRRSRINEKMKALQNLIPNSNKTDKASMLDEAIEYLKQLQLQVQMLTIRNGLSLYPMCLPGVSHAGQLPQMNMGLFEGNGPLNIDLMDLPHVTQEGSTNAPDPAHFVGPGTSSIIHSGTSLGLGSSVQAPIIPTQLHISSMVADIFREDVLPDQRLDAENCQTNLLGSEVVDKSSQTPSSYEPQSSHRENAFEALALGSRGPQSDPLTNLQSGTRIAPRFHGMSTGRTPDGDAKDERLNF